MLGSLSINRPPRLNNRVRLLVEALEDRWVPANFQVTNLDDAGAGSLRAAIAAANQAGGVIQHTITFGPNAQLGTISLTSQLIVDAKIKITGPGMDKVEISGEKAAEMECRVFTVKAGKALTIEKLDLRNGSTTSSDPNGGAIKVEGGASLSLNECLVRGSFAHGDGGGVWVGTSGHLQVRNTIIASNFAGGNGGGIAVANGTAEIQAAFIGGTWQRSLIRDNDAVGNGGGVWFDGAGNVDQRKWIIDRTDLERNTAGGEGGGLYLDWGGNTTNTRPASISDTMLNTNTANKGGGIYLKASTEFGTGVKIHNSAAMSEPGIGMYVHASTKNLGDKGIEITGSRMFVPPPGEESPFGANSIATPGPIEMPSALYIEEGAEFILADAMIYDNDGYGVSGAVISLGNNYAENSLSSSSGWIETDIVT